MKWSPDGDFRLAARLFSPARHRYVMAILNVTPDSFYDGGRYTEESTLRDRVRRIRDEGADIIDIGGESTRPGAAAVPSDEELARIRPAYEACRKLAPRIPVSIDTTKSEVAGAMLRDGAEMINDISGLTFDPEMAGVCGRFGAAVVVMHTRGRPVVMQKSPRYPDGVVKTVRHHLERSVLLAREAGIRRIITDPGIGFGKTVRQNYELLARLPEAVPAGYPVLVGVSRKSLIGKVLGLGPEDRLPATMALNLAAMLNGASFIRVHDTAAARDAVRLWEQLDRAKRKEKT